MARASETLAQALSRLAREGELYERLPAGRVRCHACGHRCLIPPGQRGVCQVRWNEDGRLLVPAGYVAGLQLDPVEKKPFFHAWPGSLALSFGMLGCDYHCSYCFVGDTPVLTPTGPITIGEIFDSAPTEATSLDPHARLPRNISVITGSGTTRPVVKAFRHRYQGPLVVIRPMYLPPVRCTPGHRWLATTDPAGPGLTETAARDLRQGHFLAVPRPSPQGKPITLDLADLLHDVAVTFSIPRSLSPEDVEAILRASDGGQSSRTIAAQFGRDHSYIRPVRSKARRGLWVYAKTSGLLVEEGRIRFPNEHRPGIPASIPLDESLARLLGYYCAEGSVFRSATRPNSLTLTFSFGHAEAHALHEVTESLRAVFGVRAHVVRRPTTTATVVSKSSLALAFAALCGKGAAAKRIPPQVFEADRSVQEAFLHAYIAGDGHVYPGGKVTLTTVSRALAYGAAYLALCLGHLPSVYVTPVGPEGRILGRAVRRQPRQYTVVWRPHARNHRALREMPTHFLVPVRSVTTEPFDGDVYNLDVDGEHSYVAGFFAAKNCQNWITSQALRDPVAGAPPQPVTPARIADLAVRHRARILTSTYNEPLITSEWAVGVFRAGRPRGLVGSYVSNGNATPEVLDYLRPWVDLYKVDLKGFDDRRYRKLGGRLDTVLETIRGLHARGFWVEVVTLLVPGFNDSPEELGDLARFLASVSPDIPWHVTAFHPDYRMRDRDGTRAPALVRAAELGRSQGLRYVYAGNLPGEVGPFEDTWCPGCGMRLVERVGYRIRQDRLTGRGACPGCGLHIPGRWT